MAAQISITAGERTVTWQPKKMIIEANLYVNVISNVIIYNKNIYNRAVNGATLFNIIYFFYVRCIFLWIRHTRAQTHSDIH